MIKEIIKEVSIPVMAKVRIGHFVEVATHFNDLEKLVQISENLGKAMVGIEIDVLEVKLAERGW